jgi:hypothetical protein
MPVSRSGVMLAAPTLPDGVSIGRPPAKGWPAGVDGGRRSRPPHEVPALRDLGEILRIETRALERCAHPRREAEGHSGDDRGDRGDDERADDHEGATHAPAAPAA